MRKRIGLAVIVLCLIGLCGCEFKLEDLEKEIRDYFPVEEVANKYDYSNDYYNNGEYYEPWYESDQTSAYEEKYPLGTAGEACGKTVVVSIYADDRNSSWSDINESKIMRTKEYLGIATDWISEQASYYGKELSFLYDWEQYQDLVYHTTFKYDMVNDDEEIDWYAWQEIEKRIDTQGLVEKYEADNIVYLLLFNTSRNNDVASCTRCWYEGMEYPYEICFMYVNYGGEEESPAAYAHEIMHTFGAPDLYMADDDGYNYGITQEYVDYMEKTESNDIMFTTYDSNWQSVYDRISNDMSEIDAYYLGWIDYSAEVEKWGFEKSQHIAK